METPNQPGQCEILLTRTYRSVVYGTSGRDNFQNATTCGIPECLRQQPGCPTSKEPGQIPGHTGIAGRVDLEQRGRKHAMCSRTTLGASDNVPSSEMAPDRSSATTLVTGLRAMQVVPVAVPLARSLREVRGEPSASSSVCCGRQMKYSRLTTSRGNSAAGPSNCPLTDERVASMLVECPPMMPLM